MQDDALEEVRQYRKAHARIVAAQERVIEGMRERYHRKIAELESGLSPRARAVLDALSTEGRDGGI
jgi:hypothetical protein